MTDQMRYALEQMALWAKGLGMKEIRRCLGCCAEEAMACEDGQQLAECLIRRANGPEAPEEAEQKGKGKGKGKVSAPPAAPQDQQPPTGDTTEGGESDPGEDQSLDGDDAGEETDGDPLQNEGNE